MKYLAAYALLALSGKKDINAQDIKTLLGSVQSHATDDEINQVIAAVKGKAIHQLIADGQSRLGSAPAPAAKAAEKKEAPKKEEKKPEPKKEEPKKKVVEEPKEEEDADFGDLFGWSVYPLNAITQHTNISMNSAYNFEFT